MDGRTDGQIPPVFYRTSSPLGPHLIPISLGPAPSSVLSCHFGASQPSIPFKRSAIRNERYLRKRSVSRMRRGQMLFPFPGNFFLSPGKCKRTFFFFPRVKPFSFMFRVVASEPPSTLSLNISNNYQNQRPISFL